MASWVEDIIQALTNLGGQATLTEIYKEIEHIRKEPLPNHWRANVRERIETHSSDSQNFKGKDLFRKVDRGTWALRIQEKLNLPQAQTKEIVDQQYQAYSIPDSFETIANVFRTIKEYRDYSDPYSSSWNEYVLELFHILGFNTEELAPRLILLKDMGANDPFKTIVGILQLADNFEEIIPGLDWESYLFFAANYYQAEWGLLTNGIQLKVLNYQNGGNQLTYFCPDLDGIIVGGKLDSFLPIFKVFSFIKRHKDEIKIGKTLKSPTKKPVKDSEWDLDYHTRGKPLFTVQLFNTLRSLIFSLPGSIIERINNHYISYSCGRNFCEITIQQNRLKIWVDWTMFES